MKQWYCNIKGQQYGPVGEDVLREWVAQHRVTAQDLVWAEGMTNWLPAGQVTEIFSAAATSPAAGGPPPVPGAAVQSGVAPHRGGTILTFGILGLACCVIFGAVAWAMGSTDLKEMAAGRMDRSGDSSTNAGRVCGMISVILALVGLGLWLVSLAVFGAGVFHAR